MTVSELMKSWAAISLLVWPVATRRRISSSRGVSRLAEELVLVAAQQGAHHDLVERLAAGGHPAHRGHELVAGRVLEHVTLGAAAHGAEHDVVVVVDGEHDDPRRPRRALQGGQHLEAVHVGQREVEQHEIGVRAATSSRASSPLAAEPTTSMSGHLAMMRSRPSRTTAWSSTITMRVRAVHRARHITATSFATSGTTTSTRVPCPGRESIVSAPPISVACSSIITVP